MLKDDSKKKKSDSKEDPQESEEPHFIDQKWVKIVFGGAFTILVLGLLGIYWFIPFNSTQLFVKAPQDSNFTIGSNQSMYEDMQFYPNMRYPSSNISYQINTTLCSLQKQNNIQEAFKRIENLTVLNFYPVDYNPEISISCNNKVIVNKSYFIAGEGGPVNITQTKKFNVIEKGEVLLIRDSHCQVPNIATHELLHALGFAHSQNPNNVMYPITDCSQTIGDNIPQLINDLYSYPSYPDLAIDSASATLKGRYLNVNITIKNYGLVDAGSSTLLISSGGTKIRAQEIPNIPVGSGITFSFTNLLTPLSINTVDLNILTNFSELEKNNNKLELALKK